MDDKSKLVICKKHIVYLALSTRLAVITLQFISNILVIDHQTEIFSSPKGVVNTTLFDKITYTFLGGFLRWDAQYFFHIAKYGYTYENTLAFFPLLPLTVRYLSIPIKLIVPILDWDSISLILFVTINTVFFVKAALALFNLSVIILNRRLAYRATILFCINPANVFFVAPYSECAFAYFSFTAMMQCAELYYKNGKQKTFANFFSLLSVSLPVALSTATRSNGVLNVGFMVYFWMSFFKKSYWPHNIGTLINVCKSAFYLSINVVISLIPFVTMQLYSYRQFCTDFMYDPPKEVFDYGNEQDFVFPGTFSHHNQSWCFDTVPLAYSYVQKHYWDVGFLRYYQLKQIPNFLLAAPIIYIILTKSYAFFKQHVSYCLNLGIFEFNYNVQNEPPKSDVTLFEKKMFVYLIHCFVLTVFCVFCVHIQVTTRMLCSASPVLYWLSAYVFENVNITEFDILTSWNGFLFTNELNREQKFVKYYFICYFFLGTILFSNNFPWT